ETEKHPVPVTWAFCVLNKSGWDQFVTNEARLAAENALARLRANNASSENIATFLEEIVDKL
ncbi:MAG: hypothetical protein PHE77_01955, partial [Candidatus Pacebacteria bacterium]|nr:hypothetical protein [Candidatus Paceibacterota bacterium]